MRESKIEAYLKKEVEIRGGKCLKLTTPGFKGIPDRLVLGPNLVHFIELKAPGKVPSARQFRVIQMLIEFGLFARAMDSMEEIDEYIQKYWS